MSSLTIFFQCILINFHYCIWLVLIDNHSFPLIFSMEGILRFVLAGMSFLHTGTHPAGLLKDSLQLMG